MRRRSCLLLALTGALALPGTGHAAPTLAIQASTLRGPAPLAVSLTVTGDAVAYSWDLGDGTTAEGNAVEHTFAGGGSYLVVVTGTGTDGETATAEVRIAALAVSLHAPRVATYGRRVRLSGRIVPAARGAAVALRQGGVVLARARTTAGGRFRVQARLRRRAPFEAEYGGAVSPAAVIVVRPVIRATLVGPALVGRPLTLAARVLPAAAGSLRVRLYRGRRERSDRTYAGRVRVRLDTRSPRRLELRLSTAASEGFASARKAVPVIVRAPQLGLGSSGPSVRVLQERLVELRFALPGVSGYYGLTTYEAVLAFQKVFGLARTGRVTPGLWRRLERASVPRPRHAGGTHIEVDKTRQVLFDVVGGELRRIVHVSTGATGNTPVGVWHVYSKVPGYNALSMFDSLFFLRGFAVHGYPSVPPYPASHGCVRTPIWIAPTLYAEHGYGSTVYIYY